MSRTRTTPSAPMAIDAPASCSARTAPAGRRPTSISTRCSAAVRRARRRCCSTARSATPPPGSRASSSSCAARTSRSARRKRRVSAAIVDGSRSPAARARRRASAAGGMDAIYDLFFRAHDRFGVMSDARRVRRLATRRSSASRRGFVLGEGGYVLWLEARRRADRASAPRSSASAPRAPRAVERLASTITCRSRGRCARASRRGPDAGGHRRRLRVGERDAGLDAVEARALRSVFGASRRCDVDQGRDRRIRRLGRGSVRRGGPVRRASGGCRRSPASRVADRAAAVAVARARPRSTRRRRSCSSTASRAAARFQRRPAGAETVIRSHARSLI